MVKLAFIAVQTNKAIALDISLKKSTNLVLVYLNPIVFGWWHLNPLNRIIFILYLANNT